MIDTPPTITRFRTENSRLHSITFIMVNDDVKTQDDITSLDREIHCFNPSYEHTTIDYDLKTGLKVISRMRKWEMESIKDMILKLPDHVLVANIPCCLDAYVKQEDNQISPYGWFTNIYDCVNVKKIKFTEIDEKYVTMHLKLGTKEFKYEGK